MDLLTWMQEQTLDWTEEQREVLVQAQNELDSLRAQIQKMQEEEVSKQRAQALSAALEAEFKKRNIRHGAVIEALLDLAGISFEEGEPVGLSEQLDALSRAKDTAFLFEPEEALPRFVPMGRKAPSQRDKAARRVMGL